MRERDNKVIPGIQRLAEIEQQVRKRLTGDNMLPQAQAPVLTIEERRDRRPFFVR